MRYFTGAAAALLLLAMTAAGVTSASAATPACVAVPACGSYVTPVGGGVALDVWQARAASDTAIKVYKTSATDRAEDFVLVSVPSAGLTGFYPGLVDSQALGKAVNIEYAPNGVPSGFCVSIITGTERAAAALRPCDVVTAANQTFNQFQTFNVIAASGDGAFVIFQAVLTGLVLNDQRAGGSGSAVISYPLGGSGTPQQLWQAVG